MAKRKRSTGPAQREIRNNGRFVSNEDKELIRKAKKQFPRNRWDEVIKDYFENKFYSEEEVSIFARSIDNVVESSLDDNPNLKFIIIDSTGKKQRLTQFAAELKIAKEINKKWRQYEKDYKDGFILKEDYPTFDYSKIFNFRTDELEYLQLDFSK